MITSELQGKLGNMMFQIAAIEDMGRRVGIDTCYPHIDKNIDDLSKPQACTSEFRGKEYFGLFKNFDWHKNISQNVRIDKVVNVPFRYTPIIPQDHTCYIGYFQSELYFTNRDATLNLFQPADHIEIQLAKYKDIVGYNTASIHVRRGDYIKLRHIYNVLDIPYYRNAMEYLDHFGIERYLIFSNDRDWCRENFKGDRFVFINDDSFVELFLMGRCEHNIIANSAFSWWGAYLNNSPNRRIIAPKIWFSSDKNDETDIVPKNWITI